MIERFFIVHIEDITLEDQVPEEGHVAVHAGWFILCVEYGHVEKTLRQLPHRKIAKQTGM